MQVVKYNLFIVVNDEWIRKSVNADLGNCVKIII